MYCGLSGCDMIGGAIRAMGVAVHVWHSRGFADPMPPLPLPCLPAVARSDYLGCYKDSTLLDSLPITLAQNDPTMTNDKCRALASAKGADPLAARASP